MALRVITVISKTFIGRAMRGRHTPIAVGAMLIIGLAGCSNTDSSSQQRKEVVDVPPLLEVSTDNDQQAVPRPAELSGQLPSDFPADLPVYVPSSLVNFGRDGGPWLELLCADTQAKVTAELPTLVSNAGWGVETSGSSVTATRNGRRVIFTISAGNPGTLIRVDY